jgi:serine/threonine protein kinase
MKRRHSLFSSNNLEENEFKLMNLIGKGQFSEVFEAQNKKSRKKYAIKVVSNTKYKKENRLEIFAFTFLKSHPNIVQYYGWYKRNENNCKQF